MVTTKYPHRFPGGDTSNIQKDKKQIFEERCREILIACGLSEVIQFYECGTSG